MKTVMEVKDLLLLQDRDPLLNIPHFRLQAGEVLGIMGPSGSGKSILIKTLGLLHPPTQGSIILFGETVNYRPAQLLPLRRRLALVFQEPLLFDATVWDNVALGLKLRKTPKSLIRDKVEEYLTLLGIGSLAQRHPQSLSTLETCRVNLAQGLVLEPDILLLDDPLAPLDQASRLKLLEELAEIIHQKHLTTIYATSDYSELFLMAHRAMLLYRGSVIQEGTVGEVMDSPRSAQAASLVGVDNIIPGYVGTVSEDEVEFRPLGTELRLYGTPRDSGLDEAYALIRSEEIELDVFPGPQWNAVGGTVTRVHPQGTQTKIHLDCGFPLVVTLPNRKFYFKRYQPGQEVTAVFDPARTLIVRKTPK
ncbi:MAG TPA: ATP-binding cassette domain-containing protein [Clostridia bacterium]|nr:ATP-binding cassette domain-containing protein [Clostridia bacterium]